MNPLATFERIARRAARRPLATLAVVGLLAVAGGLLAVLTLHPSAGTDTLVGRSSESSQATADYHRRFGDEAVVVLVREHVRDLVDSSDLGRLIELEYCLTGEVPPGFPRFFGAGSACDELGRSHAIKVVYGPGKFLKKAVDEVNVEIKQRLAQLQASIQAAAVAAAQQAKQQGLSRQAQASAASAAAAQAQKQGRDAIVRQAVETGLTSVPRIDDVSFINRVVFDPLRGSDIPKTRFAYLFPNANAAVIQARLQPGLSDRQRAHIVSLVEDAVAMPRFALQQHGSYTVTGIPAVVAGLASSLSSAIFTLLIAALLVMAATLALVFRSRLRLLPLLVALGAVGLTFGVMALAGATLTMASVAVLPVLIGLGVDYAIQFQTRVVEAESEGEGPGPGAVARAARLGVPTIATAALATGVGFLVLVLSPVPMVRGFGLLLVLGIALAFGCALTAGSATLALAGRWRPRGRLVAAARGAGELLDDAGSRVVRRLRQSRLPGMLLAARRRPDRVLSIGLALAALGWVVDTQTTVVSDIQKLVPQDLPALRNVNTLQRATGVSGEIDVTVRAPDLTDPGVLKWMTSYQQGLLNRYGYSDNRGCGQATLCPALSLPDLFNSTGAGASSTEVRTLLDSVPPYFSQAVITPDRKEANLAFGVRLMPLADQQKVVEEMRRRLDPPPGVTARLAGLPVLAAEANDKLSSPARRLLTLLAGLLAVGLALLAVFRNAERALVPLVPIALATGWSALVLFLIRIPLNPMSATLGALVIAISTEFSVLLCERYRQERAAGYDERAALERTYRSTGAAVLASGVTAIVGFGVLVVSNIAMLRNFGLVTVVDLSASLLGVLLVLPAVLGLAERGELVSAPHRAWRALLAARPRRNSRAEVA